MAKKRSKGARSGAKRSRRSSGGLSGGRTLGRRSPDGGDTDGSWTLRKGDILGGYRVVRPLGRGGMGEVYLVENIQTGFRYALKLLPSDLASDTGFRERFRREAAVLEALRHDGVVMVHHAAEEGGRFFLTMDYVDGGSLDDRLKAEGNLAEDETARVALELCDALAHAHGKGVIHRDLKPSNVLLDADEHAKLSDFGLARVVGKDFLRSMAQRSISLSVARTDGGVGLSQSDNAVVGTYEFMSPEQKAGQPADERSDIFSLGLLIYRMLTGEKAEGRFPLPSEYGCVKAWDAFLEHALATRPENRFAKVSDLATALEGPIASAIAEKGAREQAPPAGAGPCTSCSGIHAPEVAYCTQCGRQLREPARCPACNHFHDLDDAFCSSCGELLGESRSCTSCGHVVVAADRYCQWCGSSVTGLSRPPRLVGAEELR